MAGFASSTSQKQEEQQSLLLKPGSFTSPSSASPSARSSSGGGSSGGGYNNTNRNRSSRGNAFFRTIPEHEEADFFSGREEDEDDEEEDERGDYYYTDNEDEDEDQDDDDEEKEEKNRNNNGVSHHSSKVYLKNLFVVAFMMTMCTLATCVGIASAYRPSRTGMVGRRDVHPNKNVHVVAESFSDVKERKMVIDEYIEKKKEKMMRERERLEKASGNSERGATETPASASAETNDAKSSSGFSSFSSSSSSEKGHRDRRSKKSGKRISSSSSSSSSKKTRGKQEREPKASTEDATTISTTLVENITPKTILETVRDVKQVQEAEKMVKENGGSLAGVVAGIQEEEEEGEGESDGSANSFSSSSSSSESKTERGANLDDANDGNDADASTTLQTAAIVPGSVAVLGPQTSVKNSIESIELISNATSQNAQSWGIEEEEEEEDKEKENDVTITTTKMTFLLDPCFLRVIVKAKIQRYCTRF